MATSQQVVRWTAVRRQGIEGELAFLVELFRQRLLSASTFERLVGLMTRFAARLIATSVSSLLDTTLADCEGFLWARTKRHAPPSAHTVHLRRTALRDLFSVLRELEPTLFDPTIGLDLPARGDSRSRPLSDHEMTNVRISAVGRTRSGDRAALAVALAEATATTGEIPLIRWRHVDLATGTVFLAGAPPVDARKGHLSPWGRGVLTRIHAISSPEPEDFVVVRRNDYADSHSGQAAIANLLAKTLRGAGVVGPDVRPSSIRLWAGRHILQTDGVEAAAAALGLTGLDATLRSLRPPRSTT